MSNPVYIRCLNPKCGKLNPVQPGEMEAEHTCMFCGAIIEPKKKAEDTSSKGKGHARRFPLAQSESKPINRNLRKPMF